MSRHIGAQTSALENRSAVTPWQRGLLAAIASLCMVIAMLLVPQAASAAVGESEPNGNTASADVIPLGTAVTGATGGDYSDNDYFAFDVPSAGKATIGFNFATGLGTGRLYDFTVYTADGSELFDFDLSGADADGKRLKSTAMFVPAGRLYIRILGYESAASWGKGYTLTVAVAAGVVETEFNSTTATADPLALGATIKGSTLGDYSDIDFYTTSIPQAGRVVIDVRFPTGLGTRTQYALGVYNSDGEQLFDFTLQGADAGGAAVRDTVMYVPAGQLYFRILGYESAASWGKEYSLKVTTAAGNVETEFNSTTATADAVPLGRTIAGSTLGDYSDDDYYAFEIPRSARSTVDFTFANGLGSSRAYYIDIFDARGNGLWSMTVDGSQSDGSVIRATSITLPAGTVYVRIRGYESSPSWGTGYRLKVSQVERLAGADRYSTSVAVSKASFAAGVPVAYVASGAGFADALSGAPVAGLQKGPVLLSAATSVPAVVTAELKRLKPKKIVVLGGTGVISDKVLTSLKSYTSGSVVRVAGADRYATSAAISKSAFATGVSVAYVAAGADFPDALAGAPVGAVTKAPVLLTASGSLPASIAAELKRLKPKKIVILGSTASVSASVATALKGYTTGAVTRVAGGDRYATPAAISASAFGAGVPVVYIASGTQYPDALSGAPVAGIQRGPVLMVGQSSIPSAVAAELTRLKPKRIVVLGGTGAVSDAVQGELGRYIVR